MKTERRIYCKFCGAKLVKDSVGWKCPTKNCQWEHGVDELDQMEKDGDPQ